MNMNHCMICTFQILQSCTVFDEFRGILSENSKQFMLPKLERQTYVTLENHFLEGIVQLFATDKWQVSHSFQNSLKVYETSLNLFKLFEIPLNFLKLF